MMFLQELPTSVVLDIDALDSEDLNHKAKYRQRVDLRIRVGSEYLGSIESI